MTGEKSSLSTEEDKTADGSQNTVEAGEVPKLTFRIPTADEEFNRLWWTANRVEHYKETHANLVWPNNEELRSLMTGFPKLKAGTKDKMREVFSSKVYSAETYQRSVAALEEARPTIEAAFPRFIDLANHWGVNFPNEIEITVTAYGTGGNFNAKTGHIKAQINPENNFNNRGNPAHTPLHEIVHILTDEDIAARYNLSFDERERLVDDVVVALCSDLVPDYFRKHPDGSQIDPYATAETLDFLPDSIAKYVKDFPR
ncbi:MAG: hypothetical protein NT141_02390 [candidate division WWE3 bacterium]|nr:hypothetical protein [candidate division WWE3 bacterium]